MHINELDLNLLRLFDTVYRARSVSRAAGLLGLSQPAASQGLTRLRLSLKDALFVRAHGGVTPTPRAERLAHAVQSAIATLEAALSEGHEFDPARSAMTLRLHLSDIGESRFLPPLMAALARTAPGVQVRSTPVAHQDIALFLDSGQLDFAIGFLPSILETRTLALMRDRYTVMVRAGHPLLGTGRKRPRALGLGDLHKLEYVAVRTHSETLRILQLHQVEGRVRLTTSHFLALPGIVRSTDLAVVMPLAIARGFEPAGAYALVELGIPLRDFTVSLHWSRRFELDPAHRWARGVLVELFGTKE